MRSEKLKKYQKEYQKQYQKEYVKNNKDKIAKCKAEWRKNNKDKIAKSEAEWRKNNKDKIAKRRQSEEAKKKVKEYNDSEKAKQARSKNANRNNIIIENTKSLYGCMNPKCPCVGKLDPCCLDFHHTNRETKKFSVGAGRNCAVKVIVQEIEKCIILCAVCHRLTTKGKLDVNHLSTCKINVKLLMEDA